MPSPEAEDPELDFTNFMEKQKAALNATNAAKKEEPEEKKPMSPVLVRGIIFFAILLFLLGILIVLYINRPEGGKIAAPAGYRVVDTPKGPPKLEKIK